MQIKGKIKVVKQNENNNKVFSILINNDWYSIFTKEGICNLKQGQVIEAEYKQKDQFKNIEPKSIKVLEEETGEEDNKIIKQAVLKASSSYSKSAQDNISNAKILYDSIKQRW